MFNRFIYCIGHCGYNSSYGVFEIAENVKRRKLLKIIHHLKLPLVASFK